MCLYPRLIRNKKYTHTQKNGGLIPECKDERMKFIPIGCKKCIECKKQKAREWQVRLGEDVKYNINGVFVTLTFNDIEMNKLDKKIDKKIQGYARDNEICKLAVKLFRERWRKRTGKSPRHWLITELGHKGTERIHMHGIIWTDEREMINKHWGYGFTWIQKKGKTVGGKITNYITKYLTKTDNKHKEYKEIILCSAGIGKDFVENDKIKFYKFKEEDTNENYICNNLAKIGMPIYYRNKLWTEEEREKLWINRLDKEVRYVLGEEVSVKDDFEVYFNLLQTARAKNKRLGYGDDKKDWNRISYENSIRNVLRKKITKNYNKNLETIKKEHIFDITKYQTDINNLINVF